jgi:hypothetical protein
MLQAADAEHHRTIHQQVVSEPPKQKADGNLSH